MKIKTLFYTNKPIEHIKYLLASLKDKGYDYSFIGMGDRFEGFGRKLIAVNNYIKTYMDDSYTHVMVLDCWDLLVISNMTAFKKKYLTHYRIDDVVFSAEINCYPDEVLKDNYPDTTINVKFRYLNAGSWIAPINKALQITDNAYPKLHDQRHFTNLYLNSDLIKLDHNCHLFQTLYGVNTDTIHIEDKYITNYSITFKGGRSTPCILHGNGKVNMTEYINKLKL